MDVPREIRTYLIIDTYLDRNNLCNFLRVSIDTASQKYFYFRIADNYIPLLLICKRDVDKCLAGFTS